MEKRTGIRSSTKDQVAGKARELIGTAKQKAGRAINRPDIQDEGTGDRAAGTVQKKVGQIKKVFGH